MKYSEKTLKLVSEDAYLSGFLDAALILFKDEKSDASLVVMKSLDVKQRQICKELVKGNPDKYQWGFNKLLLAKCVFI